MVASRWWSAIFPCVESSLGCAEIPVPWPASISITLAGRRANRGEGSSSSKAHGRSLLLNYAFVATGTAVERENENCKCEYAVTVTTTSSTPLRASRSLNNCERAPPVDRSIANLRRAHSFSRVAFLAIYYCCHADCVNPDSQAP